MSTPVEQIKERLNIADVVGSYLKLERAGSSLKAKCPFHNEKTPSFFVSPARGSFYCFGCGKGGDVFTFVQEFEGVDFVGALRILAQRAGVELRRVDPKVQSAYARLYLLLEKATRFFEHELDRSAEARAYLQTRGLQPETVKTWRLGFAPNEWRALFDHAFKEGFTPEEMEKVGLIKRKTSEPLPLSKGEMREGVVKFYDTFRGRIMFPIADSAARVIAFSGRILPKFDDLPAQAGGKTGKYINSPETILFRKSEVLYGFDRAKLAVRRADAAILVEGQMDLLMAHQAGYEHAVASSGTALTVEHLGKLKRLTENLFIAFDSDRAGVQASERAIALSLSLGMNVRVIALKEKDPADLIAKAPEEWKTAVLSAKHVIDFLLDEILASSQPNREQAMQIEKKLLPFLRMLPSKVEQSHFVKAIAERSGLREEALWDSVKKLPAPAGPAALRPATPPQKPNTIERRVAGVLLAAQAANRAAAAERVETRLCALFGRDALPRLLERYAADRDALLAEVELSYGPDGAPLHEEEELLRHLEEEVVSTALARAMDSLAQAERQGRKDALPSLLSECKQLSERLSVLKSARFL